MLEAEISGKGNRVTRENILLAEKTEKVKAFYESNPYPGLEDKLMFRTAKKISQYIKKGSKVFYPGCGTGHGMVALGVMRPDIELFGMDLSQPSLDIASKLADKNNVKIDLLQGSYMDPLPYDIKFNFVVSEGSLHHTADPKISLINIVRHLQEDGHIFIHVYGKKYHRRRFEIIEMLDLLQCRKDDLKERFVLFKGMQKKLTKKTVKDLVMDFSLRTLWRYIYKKIDQFQKNRKGISDSIPFTADFYELNQLWIDQFQNPHEKIYDIYEVKDLTDAAGLNVLEMFSLGRLNERALPECWVEKIRQLDKWSRFRVMELYYPVTNGSISLLAGKTNKEA